MEDIMAWTTGVPKIVPINEVGPKVVEDAAESRGDVVITRNGEPIARLTPMWPSLRGSVTVLSDILAPIEDEWDVKE